MSDVVVVGAGAAGLLAALAAARGGADVRLLDCSDGTSSNLALSGGLIAAAGTHAQRALAIDDDAACWTADIERATKGGADTTVTRLVTGHAPRALDLIAASCGKTISVIADIVFPGHSAPRLHEIGGFDGKALSHALLQAVANSPRITFAPGTRVEDLIFRDGAFTGLVSDSGHVKAAACVLAAGGYGAATQRLRHVAPEMAAAQYIGSAQSDGRLIEILAQRGAPLRDMGGYQGHGHATVIGTGRLGAGLTTVGALLVNRAGRRFVTEEIGPSGLAAHVGAQPGGRAIEVYTEAMHESFLRFSSYRDAVERGAARRFDTASELCGHHEIDETAFGATLAAFNAAAQGTGQDAFGRTDFQGPVVAPFWAVEVTAALVHTQGGLTIDDQCRILGENGKPLPRLYGAGGVVVGMTGNAPSGYLPGHGLAQSFTLGMMAGAFAARASFD